MDATPFLIEAAATAFGNLLAFGVVWTLWHISKRERQGKEGQTGHLLILLVCLGFITGGLYLAA